MAHQLRGLADDDETDFTDEEEAAEDAAERGQNERILTVLEALTAAISAQKAPVVNVTAEKPRVTVTTPKRWEFTITRNAAGQISTITAESK
jgi:hypothetical protein